MTAARWRRRWPAVALVTGLVLAGGGAAGYAVSRPAGHDYGTVPPPGVSPAAATGPGRAVAAAQPGRSGPGPTGTDVPNVTDVQVPSRVQIPAIGVNALVQPTGVGPGGWLAIPSDPAHVGWWAGGGFPGEQTGAVILVGHIDSAAAGPGALYRLQDLRPGEAITVVADGRGYRYQVAALRAYAKASLPAAAVFGQQVTARLVIVSCGGPFDQATGHYLDNIVAYAVPAGR